MARAARFISERCHIVMVQKCEPPAGATPGGEIGNRHGHGQTRFDAEITILGYTPRHIR